MSDTVTLKVSMPKGTYRAVQQAAEQRHKTEAEVVVVLATPVASWVTVTVTPGSMPPLWSATRPEMAAVVRGP